MRWHLDTLSAFNNELYDKLIYERNITTESMKEILLLPWDTQDKDEGTLHRGFLATKNRVKYLIKPKVFTELPIQVNAVEKWKFREDVVLVPVDPIGFRIKPEHQIEFKEMVDEFIPFEHTNPDHFTLAKIISIMADAGRVYVCIASTPEFCKSSMYQTLNAINNRTPVFEPRSIPGILNKTTGTGNLVFDDIQNIPSEPKKAMEQMNMQIAGGSAVYLNGAMKSHNTKNKYDVSGQSITYLFNDIENYKDSDKKYFDVMFENNGAIDTRFLKIKLSGKLTQKFSRDFDIKGTAEVNKAYYIKFAKELEYLKEYKQSGKYQKKFVSHSVLELKGRKKIVYDEICWGIDQYCSTQEEYDKLTTLLDNAIIGYSDMVYHSGIKNGKENIEEERVEE